MNKAAIFLTLAMFAHPAKSIARTIVATVSNIQGDAQVYSNPSKKPIQNNGTTGTTVLYEGEYYQVSDAKVGDQIRSGNILRTRPGAHANVIFDNGDQIHLAPGSSYQIKWNDTKSKKIKFNLMYGKLRGIISKEGKEQKIIIKTKIATMGVRGTDFFISDSGPNGETEITVLRGEVEVINDSTNKTIPLKTGMTTVVSKQEELKPRETNREDLKIIDVATRIAPVQNAPKLVMELEKKALQVTLEDVKTYQPELFEKIKNDSQSVASISTLNSKTIEMTAVTAPPAPAKKGKPRIRELNDSDDQDVYDQYFKLNE
jgi:hypothetical protein